MIYLYATDGALVKRWQDALSHLPILHVETLEHIPPSQTEPSVVVVCSSLLQQNPTLLSSLCLIDSMKVLVLDRLPSFSLGETVLSQGAKGYGNAFMHEIHLQSAIQSLLEGGLWIYPEFITHLLDVVSHASDHDPKNSPLLHHLSHREQEVALLLAQGASHHEIADKLVITIRTVKAHCSAIYEKLHVKDRLALSVLLHS